ncbi:WXG100 family type VII secretion target [Clostridium gasigenes]|uniref:Uncharacterized protein n=1 Tax=Clostridium gasigenes TaxID=94869 RepID=A0A7X0SFX4_9CLOT|nr:WXG100 family type VII secretion target [Clostridium gasigenes]MBB6716885.1 hypothetical protein [Clostridium gasigenes]
MTEKIIIESDKFNEAVSILRGVGMTLNSTNKKLVASGNAIEAMWEGKSGGKFASENKNVCENIKAVGENINKLGEQINSVNNEFDMVDKYIKYKIGSL